MVLTKLVVYSLQSHFPQKCKQSQLTGIGLWKNNTIFPVHKFFQESEIWDQCLNFKKKTFWTLIINVIFREFNKRLKAILQRHQSFFIKSGVPFKLLSILLPYFPSNLSLPYHYHIGFLTGRKESDFKKKITETWLNLVTKKRGRRD